MRFVFIFLLFFLGVQNLSAADDPWQVWRGSRGWGMESAYQKEYRAENVIMISVTVVNIKKVVPMKGMCSGIALNLKTQEKVMQVHLGPTWYIERLEYGIAVGDKLEIKGAQTVLNNRPALIAAEVRNGKRFLILRDNMGIPVWTGWGWKNKG